MAKEILLIFALLELHNYVSGNYKYNNKMKMYSEKDNFSDLTTEDLINKKKSTSFATGLFAGALIGLFGITIFQAINKGVTPFLAVPFALLPLLIIMYGQVRSINRELKNRNIEI